MIVPLKYCICLQNVLFFQPAETAVKFGCNTYLGCCQKSMMEIWDKVCKSGLNKFCGRQPLKNLPSPLLNILSHLFSLTFFTENVQLKTSIRDVWKDPKYSLQEYWQKIIYDSRKVTSRHQQSFWAKFCREKWRICFKISSLFPTKIIPNEKFPWRICFS